MSGLVLPEFSPAMPAQSPASGAPIDYVSALALRQMALTHDDYPKYLMEPEICALLHYVPDLNRKMLITTLWNSGARDISQQ